MLVARALAVDEVKGRVQRCITASLDATIDEMQAEWAEEWRSDLAMVGRSGDAVGVDADHAAAGVRVAHGR